MNLLLQRLCQRGTLTGKQERALFAFAVNLGRGKLAHYRERAGVGSTPITKLSKASAWRLLSVIMAGEGFTDG